MELLDRYDELYRGSTGRVKAWPLGWYNLSMPRLARGLLVVLLLAGCRLAQQSSATTEVTVAFSLSSSAFGQGATIPRQYTCDGADQSPPLTWSQLSPGTKSLALIVEDPDAPSGTFTHWVLFNIPPEPPELAAAVSHQTVLPNGAVQGRNDFRRVGYGGPCPPRGSAHRYFFRMLALDSLLNLTPGATASEVRSAASGHALGQAELVGTYGR